MDNANLPNLTQVYPIDGHHTDPEVDIVAVHGLGANPATTWVKDNVNWLSASNMLPSVIPKARIWTFNYQSNWLGNSPINRLSTLARQLLEFIHGKINNNPEKPLVFLAHSFGGIVVAEAIILTKNTDDFARVLRSTTGLIFLGTPFRGSPAVKQAQMIVDAATAFGYNSTRDLLKHLLPGSERLLDVTQTFSIVASEEKLNVACFFEQLRTLIVRKPPRLLKWISQRVEVQIVSETSACLDGYRPVGLNTMHTKMNEFSDPGDGNYQLVSGKVLDFVGRSPEVYEARTRRLDQFEALFAVPNLQNPEFIGREDILKEIVDKMAFKRGIQARVGIWGLGGVGKSQIATRYAYIAREKYSNQGVSVFWIHAASRARFEQSYLEVGSKASIPVPVDPSIDKLKEVADWLRNESNGRWIMIVDNADDISLFNDIRAQAEGGAEKVIPGFSAYIPRCDHGSILFTSRSKSACLDLIGNNSSLIQVTNMMLGECERFLRRTLQDYQLDEEMHALITLLGHLPLALAQAAAFICRNTITTSDYVKLFKESEPNQIDLLSQEFLADGRDDVPNAIAATLTISFNQIKEREPEAARLLSIMSFFDRQDIPRALLPRGECTAVQFEMAIGTLQAYSMIIPSSSEKAYDIHALIQVSTRHWLRLNNETTRLIKQVLALMAAQFPKPEFQNWPDCARYLPHAQSVLGHVQAEQIEENDEIDLLLRTSRYMYQQGRYTDTESLLLRARDVSRRVNGVEHGSTLLCMSDLALTYSQNGLWKEAEALQVEGLEIMKKILGVEHPFTLSTMNNLAQTHHHQGRWKEAEALNLEVLEMSKRELGLEHPCTLANMNNSAMAYTSQGRWKDAEVVHLEYLEMSKRKLGLEHRHTLIIMNNLAKAYDRQGRSKEAEVLQLDTLEMSKRKLGLEHPDTLAFMTNLAEIYSNQRRWKEAEALNLEVLEMSKRELGLEHPDTLANMNNLARAYSSQGRSKEAEVLQLEILEMSKRKLRLEHPATLASMNNLANAYDSQGRSKEAEVLLLEMSKRKLGLEHLYILASMNNLAKVYDSQGRSKEAEVLLLEALEMSKRKLGLEHPYILSCIHNLAFVYKSQHRDRDAMILMTETVKLSRLKLGSEHPDTVSSIEFLGEWQEETFQLTPAPYSDLDKLCHAKLPL